MPFKSLKRQRNPTRGAASSNHNSPILSPSQPYLVLVDTLCSCEAYGMRPKNKGKIRA